MQESLSTLDFGLPYRQQLQTHENHTHDNFYLFRLKLVCRMRGRMEEHESFHLFTTKEILTAIHRYENDVNELPRIRRNNIVGYVYQTSYHNSSGVLTERYLCKFCGLGVAKEIDDKVVVGLFSAREMRRSKERFDIYINPNLLRRIKKGITWILQKVKHF